jgi:hypothetical protein
VAKKRKKQQTTNKAIIAIIAILIIASGIWYFGFREKPAEEQPPAPEEPGVRPGDLVSINYVLTLLNGTVVDTNNVSLAKQYGLTNYVAGQFKFIAGQSGKIKGFDDAVKGMKLGETITKNILPSEQVLEHTFNSTRRVLRNQPLPRYHQLSQSRYLKTFSKKPVLRDVITTPNYPWPFVVKEITNDTITIEPKVEEGKTYKLPNMEWDSSLVVKTFDDLVFRHNPKDGQVITTELGPATVMTEPGVLNITYHLKLGDEITYYSPVQDQISMPYQFKVTSKTDTQFTITRINYLPQENLVLTATLIEWTPEVKKIKDKPLLSG